MPQIEKISDIVIYRDERYYCGPGPSAVRLPDGRIMAAFRRAYNLGIRRHLRPRFSLHRSVSDDFRRQRQDLEHPPDFYSGKYHQSEPDPAAGRYPPVSIPSR